MQITHTLRDEFIELYKLLKIEDLAHSGGMAKQMVEAALITVNGESETRKRCKLRKGDVVVFEDTTITVE